MPKGFCDFCLIGVLCTLRQPSYGVISLHRYRTPQTPEPSILSSLASHQVDSTPLPPINERLAYLRPSRELLEYYRKKIAEFDEEHEELTKKLEQYKSTYEEQVRLRVWGF